MDRSASESRHFRTANETIGGKVVVQLVDVKYTPLAGLRVQYAHTTAVMNKMKGVTQAEVDPVMLDSHGFTDDDGRIEIDDVPQASGVLFYLDNDDWIVSRVPDGESFFVTPSNGWSLRPTVRQQTVTLQKPGTITLDIKYADGVPATGIIGYSVWMKETEDADRETGYPRESIEVYGAPVEIRKLPPVGRLWGNVASKREGFALTTVFDFRIEGGHRHEIIIPRDDNPRWGLEIDLSALGEEEAVHVAVINQNGDRISEHMQAGPGIVRTDSLAGLALKATVVVFGDQGWRSREIELAGSPGEWQRVSAVLEDPATVKMRVVDETGEPVHPAVALYDSGGYVQWTRDYSEARVNSGMWTPHFASADEDGRISYTDLPAGSYDFAIEAPGYFRATVPVSLTPGSETDAGRVVLRKMTPDEAGTIVIKLEGLLDPQLYAAQLEMPSLGFPIRKPLDFDENGVARIEWLDLRNYSVSVRIKPEERYGREDELPDDHWWNAKVSLNEDKKQATVTIGPDTPHNLPVDD